MFLDVPFEEGEVSRAISKLKQRKAPGPDNISAEHISYAGNYMARTLTLLYNYVLMIEYVPKILRRGIQIPLYKGKDLCNLEPNSYRGITLLSIFAKFFEMILWDRIEPGTMRELFHAFREPVEKATRVLTPPSHYRRPWPRQWKQTETALFHTLTCPRPLIQSG